MLGKTKLSEADLPELPSLVEYPGSAGKAWNEFPLGVGENGEVVWDVETNPNLTVSGCSGSGVDSFLRNAIIHCSEHLDDWEIWGIDPFRIDLSVYSKVYGLLEKFGWTVDEGVEICHSLLSEMRSRYERMKEAGVSDFRDLPDKPKAILMVIREVGVFFDHRYKHRPKEPNAEEYAIDHKKRGEAEASLLEVVRAGKAAGIYLLTSNDKHLVDMLPDIPFNSYVVLTKQVHPPYMKPLTGTKDFVPESVEGRALFNPYEGERQRFQVYFSDRDGWLYRKGSYQQ